MKHVDLTLASPEENLACDEALLDMCEDGYNDDVLRFWESPQHFVVLGYSGRIASEVHLQVCAENNIPILRRYSGGGTVVQGPGCLNFALILNIHGPLVSITGTNHHVMNLHRAALQPLVGRRIDIEGFSDLAVGSLKFSGNAQRRRQRCVLFHGTFLTNFDLPLVQRLLPSPVKQPQYRENRTHLGFMTNLNVSAPNLKEAIRNAWGAVDELTNFPSEEIKRLVRTRYSSDEWTMRL